MAQGGLILSFFGTGLWAACEENSLMVTALREYEVEGFIWNWPFGRGPWSITVIFANRVDQSRDGSRKKRRTYLAAALEDSRACRRSAPLVSFDSTA
jgi:hypothetical protein